MLSNLIDNAVKFSDINGVISISLNKTESLTSDNNNTVEKNEYVFIRIKDDGNGINPEIHSKLFSKFATKSDIGTGLGLFIAKSIIELMEAKYFLKIIEMEKEPLLRLHCRQVNDYGNRIKL